MIFCQRQKIEQVSVGTGEQVSRRLVCSTAVYSSPVQLLKKCFKFFQAGKNSRKLCHFQTRLYRNFYLCELAQPLRENVLVYKTALKLTP